MFLKSIISLSKFGCTTESKKSHANHVITDYYLRGIRHFTITDEIDVPNVVEVLALKYILKDIVVSESRAFNHESTVTLMILSVL